MSILVFGKSGQVATELALLDGVKCVGRDEADLARPDDCADLIHDSTPTAVINAAAYTAVDKAEAEEATANTINAEAPGAMARACTELGIPFVHISTDYVFDGQGQTPFKPYDDVRPINAYGRGKLSGEQAVIDAGGRYAILRTSWVFSAHGNNFLKTMLRLSETRDALSVVADQMGGPTPAKAIARACLTIAQNLQDTEDNSGVYHFSGTPDASWADFAAYIFDATGRDVAVTGIPTSDYPTPAQRPLNSRLDCSATLEKFDMQRPSWHAAVDEIIEQMEASNAA